MPGTFNAIWIGYPFAQDFDTDPGAIPIGASLWLPLRKNSGTKQQVFARVDLVAVSATRWRLSLSEAQTATLAAIGPCLLEGDFRLRIGLADQLLGLRVTIPVEMAA